MALNMRSSVVEKIPVRPREGISASFLGTSVVVVANGGLSASTNDLVVATLAVSRGLDSSLPAWIFDLLLWPDAAASPLTGLDL